MLMDWIKNLRYTPTQEESDMPNEIVDDRLSYAIRKPTPNHSGKITPKFIVMHYTAANSAESAIRTFQSASSRVSAHLTVDLDGTVYQHAPFNIKTWHAGPSQHMGYSGLNSHSIGIEIVNVGWLKDEGNMWVRRNSRGQVEASMSKSAKGVVMANARVGGGKFFWPAYPDKQLEAVGDITDDILEEYNILDIVSHEEIDTRGWKTDPGPSFPMDEYKRLVRENPHRDLDSDAYQVTASSLNVRSGPGSNYGKITSVLRGDIVLVVEADGKWKRIDLNGNEDGWVHGGYLRKI